MRTHRIEIAEEYCGERRIRRRVVPYDLLDHILRPAVGVGDTAGGTRLRKRQRDRVTVHRCGGAENQASDAVPAHDLQKRERTVQVASVILERLLYRLAHRLIAREVHDRVNGMPLKNPPQRRGVSDIDPVGRHAPSSDPLNAGGYLRGAVAEIVRDDHVISGSEQFDGDMAADISRSAGQ